MALEERFSELLPEVMIGVDAQRFAEIAAAVFTPRPVPTVGTDHLHAARVSVPEQAERLLEVLERRGWATGRLFRTGGRLLRADPDRRAVPGFTRALPGSGGSIDQSEPLGVLQVSWTGNRLVNEDLVRAEWEEQDQP